MTSWREVEDLGLHEEFDELDPMAAPVSDYAVQGDEEGEPDDVLARRNEPWTPDAGFPDSTGILRVWIDETKLITKVRLTPSWRDRIGKLSLAQAFAQSFAFINSYAPDTAGTGTLDSNPARQAERPLSWDRLDFLTRQTARLQEQLGRLGPEADGHWVGKPAVGHSPDKLAAIELTLTGELGRIEFHPRKLDEARVRQVTDAVVRAHADARANFNPGHYVAGERDAIQAQLRDLRDETLAMMRRGFR